MDSIFGWILKGVDFYYIGQLYPCFSVIKREAVVIPKTTGDKRFVRHDNADDLFDNFVIVAAPYLLRYQLGIVQDDSIF